MSNLFEKDESQEIEAVEVVEETKEAEKPESQDDEVTGEKQEEKPGSPERPPKGFVPQGALHEERERRKEFQRQLAQYQQESSQKQAILEARFQQIQDAIRAQSAPKGPSFDEDPVGALKHGYEATQAELNALKAHQKAEWDRQQGEFQRQQYIGQLSSAVSQSEAEFVKETPEYFDAVKHLKSLRVAQLSAMGMAPANIQEFVQNEAMQIAYSAFRSGRSPAEVAYQMAVASGWKKPEEKQSAETKIETLQKGAKASQSLGSGGAPKGQLSIQALAEMNDSEFQEAIKSGAWEKLGLGG